MPTSSPNIFGRQNVRKKGCIHMGKLAEAYNWLLITILTTTISFYLFNLAFTISFFIAGLLMIAIALVNGSLEE
jgi:hypothetical protein